MFRLVELTYNGEKEIPAIYPYENKDALEGDFEFKLGSALENNADELLIAFDEFGNVIFNAKVGTYEFLPRLYEAKFTTEEIADLIKCDTVELAHARFHKRKGNAIKDNECVQEVLYGFDGNGNPLDFCRWVRTVEPVEPEEPQE